MIGHLHYIMSSKYELFLFISLSVALVIINYHMKYTVNECICDSKQLTNTPFNVKILAGDYNGEFCNYRWFEPT